MIAVQIDVDAANIETVDFFAELQDAGIRVTGVVPSPNHGMLLVTLQAEPAALWTWLTQAGYGSDDVTYMAVLG